MNERRVTGTWNQLQLWEHILKTMNAAEALNGKQAGCVYLFDCEHLTLDPAVLPALMGPVKMISDNIMINYPELLQKIIVFNCPPFLNIFYRAMEKFLPKRTTVCGEFTMDICKLVQTRQKSSCSAMIGVIG